MKPVLTAVRAIIGQNRIQLGGDKIGGEGVNGRDCHAFWAVTAVTTLIPYTPNAAHVFKSACNPAAPPLSDPAMVKTFAGGSG